MSKVFIIHLLRAECWWHIMVSLQSHHMSASWLFPPSPAWQIYTWADHRLLSPPLTCSFLRRRVWGSVRSGRAHLWLMPLTLNLMTEMSKCLSSGCGKLRPSRVQSVVSSQGSMDSDMQGKCCAKMNDGWAAWLALEMFEEWGGFLPNTDQNYRICFHSQWTKIQFKTRCKQTRTLQQGKVM